MTSMCYNYSFHTNTQEPYIFLLERREWKAKRDIILFRDKYCCQKCGKDESRDICLHVHHKHYIFGLDPWEYKDSELITLCEDCHSSLHAKEKVPTYRLENGVLEIVELTPCSRCNGIGYFSEYKHVQNGVCFRCHGQLYDEFIRICESYAKENDIDLSEYEEGYRPFNEDFIEKTRSIRVCKSKFDTNKVYLVISTKDGNYLNAFLDFSVQAEIGDYLDIKTARYKENINKRTGKSMMIIKGHVQ